MRTIWLWTRSLCYLSIVGGIWLVLIPAGLLGCESSEEWPRLRSWPLVISGVGSFLFGSSLACWSGYYLIHVGGGTPFPLDPTRRLVTTGPYAVVRNPQGVALLLATAGEALILDSVAILLLIPLSVIFLECLAGPVETWELRGRFGRQFDVYRDRVPKWMPRRWRLRALPTALLEHAHPER